MKLYRVTHYDGHESSSDEHWSRALSDVKKKGALWVNDEALQTCADIEDGATPARCSLGAYARIHEVEVITNGKRWVENLLNGYGFMRSSRLVCVMRVETGKRRIQYLDPAEWRELKTAWLRDLYGREPLESELTE